VYLDLPGKPGIPTFTDVMDTSLVLHWTAPEDDGGAEITNSVIHCRPETEADWKPATADKVPKTEHALTKLKTDVVYQFKVAAVNKVGTGPFSDPSEPVRIKEVVGEISRCFLLPQLKCGATFTVILHFFSLGYSYHTILCEFEAGITRSPFHFQDH